MTHSPRAKAVLRSLVESPPSSAAPYRTAIDDAETAVADVRTAADFVAAGGHGDLRRAVAAAARADDERAVRRGRAVLRVLSRYRRVADDHFHSGRGTVLSRDGQPTEK